MTGAREYAPHGSQWSDPIVQAVIKLGQQYLPPGSLVWDPCAGTGKVFHDTIGPACGWRTFGSEIQERWANWTLYEGLTADDGWPTQEALDNYGHTVGTLTANSLALPARLHGAFDGGCVSWVFDNRQNDRYLGLNDYDPVPSRCRPCKGQPGNEACPKCHGAGTYQRPPGVATYQTPGGTVVRPKRMNYTALHGAPLHAENAAQYQGVQWQQLNTRLLDILITGVRSGGWIVMEMKDSEDDARNWNVHWLLQRCTNADRPVRVAHVTDPKAPGNRHGQNWDKRIGHTQLIVLHRL